MAIWVVSFPGEGYKITVIPRSYATPNHAILNWVQKKLELSYFPFFSPSYATPYVLEKK